MMRAPVPIIALAAVLFISGCVGNGELPEDLEEYSMGYDMHIDLPRDWVKTEWEWLPSGESSMECYPSERNRNPDIEIHIYNQFLK